MAELSYIARADAKEPSKGIRMYSKDAKLAEFTADKKKAYKFNADDAAAKVERLNANIHPMQKGYIVYVTETVEQKAKADAKPAAKAAAKSVDKVKTKSKKSE